MVRSLLVSLNVLLNEKLPVLKREKHSAGVDFFHGGSVRLGCFAFLYYSRLSYCFTTTAVCSIRFGGVSRGI